MLKFFFNVLLALSTFKKITIEDIIFWNFCKKSKKRFPNKLQKGDVELVRVTRVLSR